MLGWVGLGSVNGSLCVYVVRLRPVEPDRGAAGPAAPATLRRRHARGLAAAGTSQVGWAADQPALCSGGFRGVNGLWPSLRAEVNMQQPFTRAPPHLLRLAHSLCARAEPVVPTALCCLLLLVVLAGPSIGCCRRCSRRRRCGRCSPSRTSTSDSRPTRRPPSSRSYRCGAAPSSPHPTA